MKILILNGPNINFLGIREKSVYGNLTYSEYLNKINEYANKKNITIDVKQSNHEGVLIDTLQEAHFDQDIIGVILNGGGYTHTSVALMDAVSSISKPVIEVHFSDISKREAFRQHSYLTNVCKATFKGKGIESYFDAIDYLLNE